MLDKYIKQHRQEIEAGKFETQKIRKLQEQEAAQAEQATSDLTKFIKERRQEVESKVVILVGSQIGCLASTVNPFATGVASDTAGVSIADGIIMASCIFSSYGYNFNFICL